MAVDMTLTIIQTITAFISFSVGSILAYLILRKDPDFLLNRLFTAAIFMMGLSMFFLVVSNLPVLLLGDNGPYLPLQASYQSVVIAFFLFNLSAIFLMYGRESLSTMKVIIYGIAGNAICFFVIWFTTPFEHVALGDVISTTLFKAVIFGFLVISYLLTLVLFFLVYRGGIDGEIRRKMQFFILGWLVGGLAMISIALGDFVRMLDIIGQVLITLSVIIIYFSFSKQTSG
jgi:hypothetical protein